MTSGILPASRWARVSPTQTMAVMPAAITARARLLTVSSVSAKYWRRSEWPTMQYLTPASTSILVAISPVNAPWSSQWAFSAPSFTCDLPQALAAAGMSMAGGQTTMSTFFMPLVGAMRPLTRAPASEGLTFIFQLPAMIFVRMILTFFVVNDETREKLGAEPAALDAGLLEHVADGVEEGVIAAVDDLLDARVDDELGAGEAGGDGDVDGGTGDGGAVIGGLADRVLLGVDAQALVEALAGWNLAGATGATAFEAVEGTARGAVVAGGEQVVVLHDHGGD